MPGVPFEELRRRASEAWDAGRLDEADRFFRAGVELNPLWYEGWFYVGSIHFARGRFERAQGTLRRVLDAVPDSGPAWVLLGFSEFRLGHYDRAEAALIRGLSLGLEESEDIQAGAHHHLSLLKTRRGDFEGAVEHLLWLARSQPPEPPLLDACGLMILRRATLPSELSETERDLVRAAGWAAYASLAGRFDEAQPLFEDLVARYPEAPGVHCAYGLFLAGRGAEGALAQLEKEVELDPDNVRAHLEIAFQHLERGNGADALPSAQASVRLAPDVYSTHLALGRALLANDAVDEGLVELERAARLGPEVPDVLVALAQAYARAGRSDDVARTRQKLRELEARRQPSESP
jgi:tetratricopeptide (TPR) repeat protein